jgi:hypothetical protein
MSSKSYYILFNHTEMDLSNKKTQSGWQQFLNHEHNEFKLKKLKLKLKS